MSKTCSALLTKSPALPGVTLSDATSTFVLTSYTEVSSAVCSFFFTFSLRDRDVIFRKKKSMSLTETQNTVLENHSTTLPPFETLEILLRSFQKQSKAAFFL